MESKTYFFYWWWFNFLITFIPHAFLIFGSLKKPKDQSHTLFTWFLYFVQDGLLLFSGAEQRTFFDPLAMGYFIGSFIMVIILGIQKRLVSFGFAEISTSFLIIACTVIWAACGPAIAQIASIVSEILIGAYLIIQTWKFTEVKYNIQGYFGFLLVSIITIILTRAWTFAEVGFAVSETFLNAIILIPLVNKWLKERKNLNLNPSK
jgi:hypothetical protein